MHCVCIYLIWMDWMARPFYTYAIIARHIRQCFLKYNNKKIVLNQPQRVLETEIGYGFSIDSKS